MSLVGYGGMLAFQASNLRLEGERARASEQRAAEVVLEDVQTGVLDELARGNTEVIDGLINACRRTVMEQNSLIFFVTPTRKDPAEVQALIDIANPVGYESQIAYIGLPELDELEFLSRVGNRTLERRWQTGEVSLEFAVNFDSESILGMNSEVWGFIRCPLRGGQPNKPTLETLYLD